VKKGADVLVKILIAAVVNVALLAASDSNSSIENERLRKAVQKEIEKEKQYAREQKFYNADEYDFKGKEVDPNALKAIETIEPDYNYTDAWGACDNE